MLTHANIYVHISYRLLFSQSCPTAAHQSPLFFTIPQSMLKLISIEQVMPSNHLILSPLILLPSIFPHIRVFSNDSALCIMWPKYWNFIFIISPSIEYSGLISFKIDLFDLFAVQGTLKSLLQHHSLKASILWHSVFFMVQLSHRYMTTGKIIPLNIGIYVGKVMSLLFNMLSRFVLTSIYSMTFYCNPYYEVSILQQNIYVYMFNYKNERKFENNVKQ